MSSLHLDKLLKGTHPDWMKFFKKYELEDIAAAVLKRVEDSIEQITPYPDFIFEFLRYFGPDDALVLIMGQDPYPYDAQGLCFSIPHTKPLKPSLKTIINNLEQQKLARKHYQIKADPESKQIYCGDLCSWAMQGIVLMNASLTNIKGSRNAHKGYWKDFTIKFVSALAHHVHTKSGRKLIIMLWGNDAANYCNDDINAEIYKWSHPSPMINNRLRQHLKFEYATHFKDANEELKKLQNRPIEWDPLGYTLAFTDGSCKRNGKPDSKATFAAYIATGPLKGVEISGLVPKFEYQIIDTNNLCKGFTINKKKPVKPSNNRGEYLAWCWILLILFRGQIRGRIEIVSDCNLFIQTMKSWLPTRRKKGNAECLKNYDLIYISEILLDALRKECIDVKITHINSHRKKPSTAADPKTKIFWYGNDKVDRMALSAYSFSQKDIELNTTPSIEWCISKRFIF